MVGMTTTTFDESAHPRQATGEFAKKVNDAPTGTLDAVAALDAQTDARVSELRSEYITMLLDGADGGHRRAGEDCHRQAAYAEQTTDPAELAHLARNPIGEVALTVARNPHTTAPTLHAIATDATNTIADDARTAALHHPNVDVATLRHLWSFPHPTDRFSGYMRRAVLRAPATPGDILADALLVEWEAIAGEHPNLPADTLAAAVGNPDLTHKVSKNPNLTDAQLRQAVKVTAEHAALYAENDDDSVWEAVVAADAARHPNASPETVAALATHPDAHVRKTARDRQTGDRIRRAQAAAEQEMRDAGGSETDVAVAGRLAANRALSGKEWGEA